MARTLEEVVASLPTDRQERVDELFLELKDEVLGLRELRRVAGKAQAQIAATLGIRQPSVSRIEREADMYLSTLRSYVEAAGGELELLVKLPTRRPIRLRHLGDATPAAAKAAGGTAGSGSKRSRHRAGGS